MAKASKKLVKKVFVPANLASLGKKFAGYFVDPATKHVHSARTGTLIALAPYKGRFHAGATSIQQWIPRDLIAKAKTRKNRAPFFTAVLG